MKERKLYWLFCRRYWLYFLVLFLLGNATLDNQQQSTSISLQEIFEYTKHGYQNYLVPKDTTSLRIDAWGASGADVATSLGGLGGYISTNISVNPGQILFIYIGKRGTRNNQTLVGGEGGESTDVRLQRNNLDSRIVVAGGGGGAGILWWGRGGAGGHRIVPTTMLSSSFLRGESESDGKGEHKSELQANAGKAGTLFGGIGGHSYTTGRHLTSQEGVRRGDGKVVIRPHQVLASTQQQHRNTRTDVHLTINLPPTLLPTRIPSDLPTVLPTRFPTSRVPTYTPTIATKAPSKVPTFPPTVATKSPTVKPTRFPTSRVCLLFVPFPSSSHQNTSDYQSLSQFSFVIIPIVMFFVFLFLFLFIFISTLSLVVAIWSTNASSIW